MATLPSYSLCLRNLPWPSFSTWSISRWRHLTENDGGPRPVRSVDEPYGLGSLSLGELRDIILGNSLLFFAFAAMLVQASLRRILAFGV